MITAVLTCFAATAATGADNPLEPPAAPTLVEARELVKGMIDNPRGPYSRIRWFCNDGTVQPPVPYACREHGGGRQHAEYSPQRERLAELGWHVGTIFAAMDADELLAPPRRLRLRELALERYLIDVDNGWVLRQARSYRGRVQVEVEAARGRELLQAVLADPEWVDDHFLLAREAVRVIPHGEDTDLTRALRRAAVELAELDPSAEPLRAEIHGAPTEATAGRVRAWLAGRQTDPTAAALAEGIAGDLERLYGAAGRRERIQSALRRLTGSEQAFNWRARVLAALEMAPQDAVVPLCDELGNARASLVPALPPDRRLVLFDAMSELETEVQLDFQVLREGAALTRAELLETSDALARCGYASGLLSAGELLDLERVRPTGSGAAELAEYRAAVEHLRRVPGWAAGAVRYTFAEALVRYTALDPRAARFTDDLLRSSPLFRLGELLGALGRDVEQLAGSLAELDGADVATAVALNPGLARGELRIYDTLEAVAAAPPSRGDVVVLPETIAELPPVAGILTLGEGNALSHVQLLARNFGIPNVAVDRGTADALQRLAGREVLLAVDGAGNVLLTPLDDGVSAALDAVLPAPGAAPSGIALPEPDLAADTLLPLGELSRSLSGRVVGPKAANLGELNRLFPGRVAPAVAIPFGIYARHLREAGIAAQIETDYAERDAGILDDTGLAERLAGARTAVAALRLDAPTRDALTALMAQVFGPPGTYGVFVRSDTNVEDLPQFTGAGLNETVPNVVGLEAQLAAVPRVWSSVLSPRALAWRASVLADPTHVYASVLLMKSVPATKSGVMVTSNLVERGAPGLTVSTAWGVGGAVAGEAAESVVLLPAGLERVSEAKTPWQRRLAAQGGIEWVPAAAGPVLSAAEAEALRVLAAEVAEKYVAATDDAGNARPWDIEFGFVEGELTLFQIRPLVERSSGAADRIIARLRPQAAASVPAAGLPVDLGGVPGGAR